MPGDGKHEQRQKYFYSDADDELIVGCINDLGAYEKSMRHGESMKVWKQVADMVWKRIPPGRKVGLPVDYCLDGEAIRNRVRLQIMPKFVASQRADVIDAMKDEDITPEAEERVSQFQQCKQSLDEWDSWKKKKEEKTAKIAALEDTLISDGAIMSEIAMKFSKAEKQALAAQYHSKNKKNKSLDSSDIPSGKRYQSMGEEDYEDDANDDDDQVIVSNAEIGSVVKSAAKPAMQQAARFQVTSTASQPAPTPCVPRPSTALSVHAGADDGQWADDMTAIATHGLPVARGNLVYIGNKRQMTKEDSPVEGDGAGAAAVAAPRIKKRPKPNPPRDVDDEAAAERELSVLMRLIPALTNALRSAEPQSQNLPIHGHVTASGETVASAAPAPSAAMARRKVAYQRIQRIAVSEMRYNALTEQEISSLKCKLQPLDIEQLVDSDMLEDHEVIGYCKEVLRRQ